MAGYLLGAVVVLAGALYASVVLWRKAASRARIAEGRAAAAEARAAAAVKELVAREEDRHAMESDLARLRAGSPADRVGASLDVLQDVSARTRAPARKLAESRPPAADGN